MSNNHINYSDILHPDSSFTDAIEQLKLLNKTYQETAAGIKAQAAQLAESLGKVNSATEEGRNTTRKAATEADRLQKAQQGLEQATGENARKIAELNAAKREANQMTKLSIRLNNSAEGSYDKLSAQYSLNKIRLNAMSKAQREATAEGKKLEQETKEIYEEMKRLQEATGKMTLNVGNYTEAIQQALGVNNQFGQSILALGEKATRKDAFKAMSDGAKALGKTLLGLLKNPVFLAIAGVAGAGAAAKWFYDYNKGLIEATRLTQQFTDKQGADLRNFRNDVQAVADTFGKDFQETLQATNTLARQFGISFEESLKLIKDGFLVGGDLNGEFLDTIKEYPAYFKEAGLSAEDFVSITAQSAKAGIFSDKAVDTIKEGNLRLREMTTATRDALEGIGISADEVQKKLEEGSLTTFQVMQMVSEKLNELPDSAAVVGTAIADIFGGPGEDAGLQYLRLLKDINTDLDVAKERTGTLAKLQEQQLESQMELEKNLSALFDITGGTFEELTTKAKIFVNNGLNTIIEGVVGVVNYFIDLYNESALIRVGVQGIATTFKNTADTIGNLFGLLVDQFKAGGRVLKGVFTLDVSEIKEGFLDVGRAYQTLISQQVQDIKENFSEGLADIQSKIKPIVIPVSVAPVGEKVMSVVDGKAPAKSSVGGGVGSVSSIASATDKVGKANGAIDFAKDLTSSYELKGITPSDDAMKHMTDDYIKNLEKRDKAEENYLKHKEENEAKSKEVTKMAADATLEVLSQVAEARVAAADAALQQAQKESEGAQSALDAEREARANGYASNVAMAQKELDFAKKNEEKALKEKKKAQKQQAAIQTIQQIGDLVTGSAKIWGQLGFPFAIPAIATMWASFAASKIIAASMAKSAGAEKYANGTVELLEGGSHASGHDIDLGRKKDGKRRRAEGGEFLAVINKRNSRRFRSEIPKVINALNDGSFADKYLTAYDGAKGMNVTVNEDSEQLRMLSDDVREIRRQSASKTYVDGNGNIVEQHNNVRRIIKR